MNFLQPWMLLGVLAALVPVLIHLLNRSKAQRVRFPMLTVVAISQERRAPALKLKRWLLLAARIGILLLIPLAMAQPYTLCGEPTQTVSDRYPAAIVLVVDVSASMSRDGGVDVQDAALSHARSVVRGLRPWDQVRILLAGDENTWLQERWTGEQGAALRSLDAIAWEHGASNLPQALMEARAALLDASLPVKRTYVITDNDAHAWQSNTLSPELLQGMGELVVWAPPFDADAAEVSIEALAWEDAATGGQDLIEIQATLQAHGAQGLETVATLQIDGEQVSAQPVALEPGEREIVRFNHNFTGDGAHEVRVSVDGPGVASLQERVTPVHLSRAVRALLVNGASSAVQRNDELYYLSRALDVDVGERQAIHHRTITPERFADTSLEGFDVVLLANVEALDVASVDRLREFVTAGGGLWITMGSLVRPEQYNRTFGDLLPRALRTLTKLSSPEDADANIRATRFADIDHASPLFRIFAMRGGESLQSARVFSYMLLEPDTRSEARTLASYGDGGPAVVERAYGAGRVLMWTTTIDHDWTDLPIRTAYLPLAHRSIRHLAQRGAQGGGGVEIGDSVPFDFSGLDVELVELRHAAGSRVVLELVDDYASFRPTVPGGYEVSLQRGGTLSRAEEYDFAVNARHAEAAYAPVAAETIEAWRVAGLEGARGDEVADVEENRRSTWPALLLVALFLLYFESLLGVRRRVWSSFRRPRGEAA